MTQLSSGVQHSPLSPFAAPEHPSSVALQTPKSQFSRNENLFEILDLLAGQDGRSSRGIEDLLDWMEGRP
ncbi:hypothetical protein [Meridianimarinicoccus aquatilis]|uniref:Uncharacterized protein n=1 Tax=Meridianimarinicoccus aquatilis TaxID=2552766 RepID=A0A4V3BBQ2_9RHOB|nr:hypothetical protein [Fluviibacterium aquatile]TDL87729.1 hypothetical protein E2L05_10915 [Fluviibacterium aquatile]